MKLVIVGGVAGGASAATRARRLSEEATIVMFERGPDVSFANCGLPYYVGSTIADRGKLLVTTPEKLHERFRLDVRTRSSVQSIDRARKVVRVRELATGREYEESYDKLILSPGAQPLRPPLPGIDLPGVMTLRNLQDVDRIKQAVDAGAKRAVMVGAGFIGLELVENLVHRKVQTTLIEAQPQVLPLLDVEMATPLAAALDAAGVRVLTGAGVTGITAAEGALAVTLASGEVISTDLVLLGIGVRPENQLAVEAGLGIAPRGGILVDEYLCTTDPDIFAVGDAVATKDALTGETTQVPLAGPANRQGRIAADNVFGRKVRYRGTQGTAILGLFGKIAAVTGATEKMLQRSQTAYRKVYVHPAHHAGYYPGAEAMTLKLLFAPDTGKLLGAQGVGGAGVDKRIDVLAVALQAGLSVYDLEEMELCYSPQFGSAKDPVNMAGFVAAGMLRGDHPQVSIEEILKLPAKERPFLVDVRTPKEFSEGHIPGAINIPVDVLRDQLTDLPRGQHIAVYCQVGQRGYIATRILRQHGFDVVNISGGYKTYRMFNPAG
jgi:NADPH-dependent 2,4-dienoyl-CoA reductase/sulfur reductase-like enzyme/rhodanese-related sulfurtransferase